MENVSGNRKNATGILNFRLSPMQLAETERGEVRK
jgi:hypothetical protein